MRVRHATPPPTKSKGGTTPQEDTMEIKIVEKKNHLAVHGLFDSYERAEWFLHHVVPEYVAKGYYMDKTLKADDFTIEGDGF
jgi:hypothetical protein